MLIAFLTSNIMFPSRIAGVVQRLHAQLETAANLDALRIKLAGQSDPAIVLLDLNTPGLEPPALVRELKSLPVPPRAIIAFGPHVHEEKLAAARSAGCDVVLTQGQFDRAIQRLLEQWITPNKPD
jgi:CheY-like chemotaxis protein